MKSNINLMLVNAYTLNHEHPDYINYYDNGEEGKGFERMVMLDVMSNNVVLEIEEEEEA